MAATTTTIAPRRARGAPSDLASIHQRRWAILAVLCLSVFLAVVDNTIVNVALPRISEQLQATTSQLQWVVDAYSLVFAALLLVGGSLGDRFGRRGALQVGLVLFAACSTFAGLSGSAGTLIVARCLMGAAAALIFPATLAILSNTFTDARERAAAVGAWTGVVGLAVALGPLSGGLLLRHFSWGAVFFVNLPVAAVALGLGAWLLPTSRDPAAPRLDLLGFGLSIAGVAAVVYSTIEAPARGWSDPLTLGGYCAGIGLLVAFGAWERRVAQPMLDIGLFRNIRFSAASLSIAVAFFGLFGFIFMVTQYFQLVRGYDALSAGVHTLPFALATGAISPFAPHLARRLGAKVVVPAGLMLMAGGFFVASTVGASTPYFGPVLAAMLLMAAGLGLVSSPSTDAILAVLPPAKAGVGSAVNDVTRELGGTIGVAVVGAVFSSVYGPDLVARLHGLGLSPDAVGAARQSPAAALAVAGHGPARAAAATVDAVHQAFVAGLGRGSLVCAGVVGLGAVFAFLVLPRRLPRSGEEQAVVRPPAELVGVAG